MFHQSASQHAHRLRFVLVLAFFVLNPYDNPRRNVRNTNRRFGLIHLLTAGTTRTHRVDLQVFISNFDINIRRFCHYRDSGGTRMNTALSFRLGNTLNSMSTTFKLQLMKRRFSRNRKNNFLHTAKFVGRKL